MKRKDNNLKLVEEEPMKKVLLGNTGMRITSLVFGTLSGVSHPGGVSERSQSGSYG
jgi:hypothetical protein